MYAIFAQEIAEVDLCEFEKIGLFQSDVLIAPCHDLVIALKGTSSSVFTDVTERQHSFYLCLDAVELNYMDLDSAPRACVLYRYQGSTQLNYVGHDFVELRCEHKLGIFTLIAYFLVLAQTCEFGIITERGTVLPRGLPWLWKEGFIKAV